MTILKQRLFKRLMNQQQGEGGEGGGGDAIAPEVQAQIDAAVAAAVGGLKSKNSELLGKLKDASTNLQRYDGIDPDAVRNILSKFANDEEAALIAKGDIDTVLSKRTERMSADFGKKLQAETDRAIAAEKLSASLRERALSDAVRSAATKAGALPEASDDFVFRSRGQFSFNDEGDVVALGKDGQVVYGKDGKTPLTPHEWAESLRDTAPHLWPRAQGAGAPGNYGGKATKSFSDMTEGERVALYRDNPAKFAQLSETHKTQKA